MKRFAATKLTNRNSAGSNHIFLLRNVDKSPYLAPVAGWKIVGYGKAPWPGISDGFAVVFERTSPEDSSDNNSMPEGTLIWQHMGENDYKRYVHYSTQK